MGPRLSEALSLLASGREGDFGGHAFLTGAPKGLALHTASNFLGGVQMPLTKRPHSSVSMAANVLKEFLSLEGLLHPSASRHNAFSLTEWSHFHSRATPASFAYDAAGVDKCKSWADGGQCESNPAYMHSSCQFTCCQKEGDKNASCADWAASGECDRNPLMMKKECLKSCNVCQEPTVPGWPEPK
mmetsp:Transcript_34141/g.98305  ORF Transcript_34141/g.98305 Transcript_34141/m.98305 type:complete len:186 (+) Transcript_34141:83-640(+)